ncbi:MAG: hypothetical protein J0L87_06045 [Bacteroidetes bacterium]|nr:hypothetical protein [Bacteroidota bacterium]
MKRNILILGIVFLQVIFCKAQNFNYSFVKQNQSYTNLADSSLTALNDNQVWDDNTYLIPIGFSFQFAGQSFDSLKVRTNGTITFDSNNKFNFVCLYKNFICDVNSEGVSQSPINKELVVLPNGNKQLRIEFKNVFFMTTSGLKKHTNFQIWLTQGDNSIEFHMGDSDSSIGNENFVFGLINMNPSPSNSTIAYLISGDPTAPVASSISFGVNLVHLLTIPPSGTTYIFTAN